MNYPSQNKKEKNQRKFDRLWEHERHEDNIYNERQNYFLVAESMLIVACSTIYEKASVYVISCLGILGLLLTIIWVYVNRRQWYVVSHIRSLATMSDQNHMKTYTTRKKWRLSSIKLLSFIVPIIIGFMWTVLIIGGWAR